MTTEQIAALHKVAQAFGWDRMPLDQMRLVMWAAFHYYAQRLPADR